MATVEVSAGFVVQPSGSPDDLERHLDAVMEELVELDCGDPSIAATLGTGQVRLSLLFDPAACGIEPAHANMYALAQFRTAVHAAGGGTAGWPVSQPDEPEPDAPAFETRFTDHHLVVCS